MTLRRAGTMCALFDDEDMDSDISFSDCDDTGTEDADIGGQAQSHDLATPCVHTAKLSFTSGTTDPLPADLDSGSLRHAQHLHHDDVTRPDDDHAPAGSSQASHKPLKSTSDKIVPAVVKDCSRQCLHLHSLHLGQPADSVETLHGLFCRGSDGLARAFFTVATYHHTGMDQSLRADSSGSSCSADGISGGGTGDTITGGGGGGRGGGGGGGDGGGGGCGGRSGSSAGVGAATAASAASVERNDDTAATPATGPPQSSVSIPPDAARKAGTVHLFCLQGIRAWPGRTTTTRLHLLDVVDARSAVFDVAWLCGNGSCWATAPLMAVACADASIRLFACPRPAAEAAAAHAVRATAEAQAAGMAAAVVATSAATPLLHLVETVTLPGSGTAPRPTSSSEGFDNAIVRVLSLRWSPAPDRRQGGTTNASGVEGEGSGRLRRQLVSTQSDGSVAVWTCTLEPSASCPGRLDVDLTTTRIATLEKTTTAAAAAPAVAPTTTPTTHSASRLHLRHMWQAHSYFGAASEVWTACFHSRDPGVVYSGADDGSLKMWLVDLRGEGDDDDGDADSGDGGAGDGGEDHPTGTASSALLLQQYHFEPDGHGVTVLRMHPSGQVLASGSYDGSVCLWNPRDIAAGPLRRVEGSGGVWRLQWHPSAAAPAADNTAASPTSPAWANLLLAACMHGGTRVLDFGAVFPVATVAGAAAAAATTRTVPSPESEAVAPLLSTTAASSADTGGKAAQTAASAAVEEQEEEVVMVVASESHAPGSIVYGADWMCPDRATAATCSFYDCHLTVWDVMGGEEEEQLKHSATNSGSSSPSDEAPGS